MFSVSMSFTYIRVVANFDNIRWMFDSQPGQLECEPYRPNTAQVNECAVAGEGFDNALITFANFNLAPEFFFQSFLLLFENV